jgi:hypothetical protein
MDTIDLFELLSDNDPIDFLKEQLRSKYKKVDQYKPLRLPTAWAVARSRKFLKRRIASGYNGLQWAHVKPALVAHDTKPMLDLIFGDDPKGAVDDIFESDTFVDIFKACELLQQLRPALGMRVEAEGRSWGEFITALARVSSAEAKSLVNAVQEDGGPGAVFEQVTTRFNFECRARWGKGAEGVAGGELGGVHVELQPGTLNAGP